jgi:AraC-like DNA-binding protein
VEKVNSESIERAIVISQLIYTSINLGSYMLDVAGNRIYEIPDNLVDNCFCSRYSRALGIELDLDAAFKRFRDACTLDTILTHCCPYGLSAITVPVKAGDEPVAVISFGPILTKDPKEILNSHVYLQPGIDISDQIALAQYLYSLQRYHVDSLSALSQIVSLLFNKDDELSCKTMIPISGSEWKEDEYKHYTCPDVVEAALRYIAEHYTDDISLTDVAEQVFVHPTYLSKLFNQYVSFNFKDYLNHLRITKARHLLLDPSKAIASICFQVGFTDQSYFNRVFKAIEGITPGQFRDQHLPKKHKVSHFIQKMDSPDKYRFLRLETFPVIGN